MLKIQGALNWKRIEVVLSRAKRTPTTVAIIKYIVEQKFETTYNLIRKRIEVVITARTRNAVTASSGTWVRIPPLPPIIDPYEPNAR